MSDPNNQPLNPQPESKPKVPRKPRGPSRMIVGVEMVIGNLPTRDGEVILPPDTRIIVIHGRAGTIKGAEKLAEDKELTGEVVIACERARFPAAVRQQWFKGVAKK